MVTYFKFRSLRPVVFAVLLMLAPALSGCSKPVELSESRFLMHTYIEIKVVDSNTLLAQSALDGAFQIFTEYESKYNFYNPESILSKINRGQAGQLQLPPELDDILTRCLTISAKSGGAFDITVGPLVRLWNFGAQDPRIPEESQIKKLLPLVGYRRISIKEGKLQVKPGTSIDLSGAIKGFAVDRASEYLIKKGISSAMVNGGGNIRVIGKNIKGLPWKLGIVDPRATDEIVGYLYLDDDSTSTSGDYQSFFIKDGKRYHHLLDPHTGYPVDSGCSGVTIVSKSAATADMLSTTAFVLGPEKGMQLLKEMDCQGIFITGEDIRLTPGLGKKVEILSRKYRID